VSVTYKYVPVRSNAIFCGADPAPVEQAARASSVNAPVVPLIENSAIWPAMLATDTYLFVVTMPSGDGTAVPGVEPASP
jgi:hypothetical protein